MSVRGYRIAMIQYAERPIFTASDKDPIYSFLTDHEDTIDRRNCEGGGQIEVHVDALKEARELDLDDGQRERLEEEIKEAEENEWVLYDLF